MITWFYSEILFRFLNFYMSEFFTLLFYKKCGIFQRFVEIITNIHFLYIGKFYTAFIFKLHWKKIFSMFIGDMSLFYNIGMLWHISCIIYPRRREAWKRFHVLSRLWDRLLCWLTFTSGLYHGQEVNEKILRLRWRIQGGTICISVKDAAQIATICAAISADGLRPTGSK